MFNVFRIAQSNLWKTAAARAIGSFEEEMWYLLVINIVNGVVSCEGLSINLKNKVALNKLI